MLKPRSSKAVAISQAGRLILKEGLQYRVRVDGVVGQGGFQEPSPRFCRLLAVVGKGQVGQRATVRQAAVDLDVKIEQEGLHTVQDGAEDPVTVLVTGMLLAGRTEAAGVAGGIERAGR
jgi:hypothetical protein